MEKISEFEAKKIIEIPNMFQIMTIDGKKSEIEEIESFLTIKNQELLEMQELGLKSEKEEQLLGIPMEIKNT